MTGVQLPGGVMKGTFLFAPASRPALGPTQFPMQWAPVTLSAVVKRPGSEAEHLPLSNAEIKDAWSYTSTPQYVFMVWCFVKQRISSHGVVLSQSQGQIYLYCHQFINF